MILKKLAKDWLPPALQRLFRKMHRGGVTFIGPFATWEEAVRMSSGYDSHVILDKVLGATLKVKHGVAAYERDSVLFDEVQHNWPVSTGLLWASAQNKGFLSVLDFGGSLGSSYFQNSKFIECLKDVRWSIVEQSHFVKAGREYIQDERLFFYKTINECLKSEKPNIVLLSSVLQYLTEPWLVFEQLLAVGADLVIVDRVPISFSELIKVQVVPSEIYSARYPIRYYVKADLIAKANEYGYSIIGEFNSLDNMEPLAPWMGLLFCKKSLAM